jgi:hypothetical protein
MAHGVRVWGAIALLASGTVAVVYLPPRGGVTAPELRFAARVPQLTPARLRAQDVAERWRATQAAIRLLESAHPLVRPFSAGRSNGAGPTVIVDSPDSVSSLLRPVLTAMLDTVWSQLGLGETKVAVVVVFEAHRVTVRGFAPVARSSDASYLLPDSGNRTTCGVLIPAGYWITNLLLFRRVEREGQFREWLKGSLGPCAFYAAYGNPGKPVRSWLARRNFDLALYPVWDTPGRPRLWGLEADPARQRWWWDWVYNQSLTAVACLARRPDACRTAVLEGVENAFDDSVPRVVTLGQWWWKSQRLVAADRYLSDVVREVGRDRFLRFWSSTQPVDTALAAALRMPVGEWTVRWERRFAPPLPLGAAGPLSASVLAVLLAAAAVGSVALTARRRQVR